VREEEKSEMNKFISSPTPGLEELPTPVFEVPPGMEFTAVTADVPAHNPALSRDDGSAETQARGGVDGNSRA